jgi:HSP20 family protein
MTSQRRPISLEGEFRLLSTRVEHMWDQLTGGHGRHPHFGPSLLEPPVDVYSTPEAVMVIIEAPGMRGQEVRLEIEPDRLTIQGEKRGRHCPEEHVYSQLEIVCGRFERTVQLPAMVDPEGAQLSYDDGYIEVRLPRAARQPGQRLRITVRQS